ncbi:A24 family peptidase [Millisia brevis]|uniref:A24 family peptidase n=1 Tax=Millisia brevis TaxID=264148 RepID=UPI001FDEC5FE|nr:A24 family peptidase [Millisia brevis]
MEEAMWAAAAGLLIGGGPVARWAGRWTSIDPWWWRWCASTCALWAGSVAAVLVRGGAEARIAVPVAVLGAAGATLLSVLDLRERRLPHLVTAAVGAGAITIGTIAGDGRAAVIGAAVAYGAHLLVRAVAPGALGGGDVQLTIAVGALAAPTGPVGWACAFVLAAATTALLGGRVRGASVPHGPSLCVAAMLIPMWSATVGSRTG